MAPFTSSHPGREAVVLEGEQRQLDAMEKRRRSLEEQELPLLLVMVAAAVAAAVVRGETNKTQAHPSFARPPQPEEKEGGESDQVDAERNVCLFVVGEEDKKTLK